MMYDEVNNPYHYCSGNYECIEVMIDVFGIEAVKKFCEMNAFKYLWRSEKKNGSTDIEKASWYLNYFKDLELRVGKEDE